MSQLSKPTGLESLLGRSGVKHEEVVDAVIAGFDGNSREAVSGLLKIVRSLTHELQEVTGKRAYDRVMDSQGHI